MPHGDPESYRLLGEATGLDPEVLQALAEMELLDEEKADAMVERARYGDMVAGAQMPQATHAGGATIAPDPLQYVAPAVQGLLGARGVSQSGAQIEALRRRKQMAMNQGMYGQMPTSADIFGE